MTTHRKETVYEKRGVSPTKEEVHKAIEKLDAGLFPGAFCKLIPDSLTNNPKYCLLMHSDGPGTKLALAYMAWKENLISLEEAWEQIQWDSLIMNLDDAGCVGALGPFIISSTINRNTFLIPGEAIAAIINGCQKVADFFTNLGISCTYAGGETADVPDLTRTAALDNTIFCRMRRDRVIDASRIVPGDVIVGFSSVGQAEWETKPNSGIGANGLTNARHDTLNHEYAQEYPETFSPEIEANLVYRGKFRLDDRLPGDERFTVASALLSPTRTYLPLVKKLVKLIPTEELHGLIHCSGGGQTKIKKFGNPGNLYIKNDLFPVPPLFRMLKNALGITWWEMYKVYNMGHRLEVVVSSISSAQTCIAIAEECGIEAKIIGKRVRATDGPVRKVIIESEFGELVY